MNNTLVNNFNRSRNIKIFLLLFSICFIVYVFTSDGHRYTIDEDAAEQQAMWLATLTPHSDYIEGESAVYFNYPHLYPDGNLVHSVVADPCENGLICSQAPIGHSLSVVPFILVNQNFEIITDSNLFTIEDFDDVHYVWWRNSIEPDFTFVEIFYGPFFTALSVGIFFIICRTYEFSIKNSIIVSLLFGFSTIAWAYSQTSLSSVFITFLFLLSFLLFRKFQKNNSYIYLGLCGITLAFSLLTRLDTIFFILVLSGLILYTIIKDLKKYTKIQNLKIFIKSFVALEIPIIVSICTYQIIHLLRYGTGSSYSGFHADNLAIMTPLPISFFGLLFSPGVGIFIFAPILFTVIMSYSDFYKKNKLTFFLMLGTVLSFIIWFAAFSVTWHGLVSWSARYLLPIIPFLLIPLAASLTIRHGKIFTGSIIFLGVLGAFFNFSYLVQDVSWFVWGQMGNHDYGLYSLDGGPLRISPLILWTFEYSQLTQAINLMFLHLQPDIFLLKILGSQVFTALLIIFLVPLISALIITIRKSLVTKNEFKYNQL